MDLQKLKRMSLKDEPMRPHTIRIPATLDEEIRGFCGKTNIRFSVIFRECVRRGWKEIKNDSPEIRQLVEELL